MVRMEKVFRRTDDMLIVRGVNVFPRLIERSLLEMDSLAPQHEIAIDRQQDSLDTHIAPTIKTRQTYITRENIKQPTLMRN